MSQINPFTGSIVQAPYVQRTAANDKDQQLRRVNDLSKNAALHGDELHHQVESSEAITPVHDEAPRKDPKRSKKAPQDDGESHVDVKG